MARPTDARPDDAVFRVRVEAFALLRRFLPLGILAGAIVGPPLVVDPGLGVWISVPLFCASLFVLWTIDGLPLYPAHTFGIEYRFEDERFDSESRRCVRCETVTDEGTHRRYARQFVVLGVPIHTLAWGSNDFCPNCVGADPGGMSVSEPDDRRDPATGPGTAEADGPAANSASDPSEERSRRRRRTRDEPGTEIVRRVDLHDETTALEVRRAFDDATS